MKIDSVLTQGITGIQRGIANARNHAEQIASADQFNGESPASLVEPLVGLIQDRLQVAASAKVVEAVDDMLGSLLDEKA